MGVARYKKIAMHPVRSRYLRAHNSDASVPGSAVYALQLNIEGSQRQVVDLAGGFTFLHFENATGSPDDPYERL